MAMMMVMVVSALVTATAEYIHLPALIVNHAENLTQHHLLNILLAWIKVVAVVITVIDRATVTIVLILATVPVVGSTIKLVLIKLQARI